MRVFYLNRFLLFFIVSFLVSVILSFLENNNYKPSSGYFLLIFMTFVFLSVASGYLFSKYIQEIFMEGIITKFYFILLYSTLALIYFISIKSSNYFLNTGYFFVFLFIAIFLGIFLFVSFRFIVNLIAGR